MSTKAKITYEPLSKIKGATRNGKDHDLGAIITSISRFGFTAPVLIDERTGKLVAGHGRVEALRAMKRDGQDAPARVGKQKNEWMVPVIRGVDFPSDDEAEAYLIADNRLVELGGWDDAALVTMLKDLAEEDALEGTGYDGEDLDRLIADIAKEAKFLDDVNADGDKGDGDDDDKERTDPTHVLTFPLSKEDRKYVMDVLRIVQENFNAKTSMKALVLLCRYYDEQMKKGEDR